MLFFQGLEQPPEKATRLWVSQMPWGDYKYGLFLLQAAFDGYRHGILPRGVKLCEKLSCRFMRLFQSFKRAELSPFPGRVLVLKSMKPLEFVTPSATPTICSWSVRGRRSPRA